jgi:hypothetical protein
MRTANLTDDELLKIITTGPFGYVYVERQYSEDHFDHRILYMHRCDIEFAEDEAVWRIAQAIDEDDDETVRKVGFVLSHRYFDGDHLFVKIDNKGKAHVQAAKPEAIFEAMRHLETAESI